MTGRVPLARPRRVEAVRRRDGRGHARRAADGRRHGGRRRGRTSTRASVSAEDDPAARSSCDGVPRRRARAAPFATGGGSDANVFAARGVPTLVLSCGHDGRAQHRRAHRRRGPRGADAPARGGARRARGGVNRAARLGQVSARSRCDADGVQRLAVVSIDGRAGRARLLSGAHAALRRGDRVLLNTTAVDLGLGTGGVHFVVAERARGATRRRARRAVRRAHHEAALHAAAASTCCRVEEQERPHHDVMATRDGLGGMPVVCCGLHSQVPLVAAAVKQRVTRPARSPT